MLVNVFAIENHEDFVEAHALISHLMSSKDPQEQAQLRVQSIILAAYEAQRWPREPATAADILEYIMNQHDLSPPGLVPYLGTRSRVTEVLQGKRPLSLTMIRKLHSVFNIPADILIYEKPTVAPAIVA